MSNENKIEPELAYKILNSSITCILDENISIYYSNRNFRTLVGYSESDLQGKFLLTLKSRDQSDSIYEFLIKTIELGETWKGELQLLDNKNNTLWLDTTITPIKTAAGKNKYIATFIDITERKTLILNLKQRAQRQGLIAILGQLSLHNTPINDLLRQALSVVCGSLEVETGLILELSIDGRNALVRAGYNTKQIVEEKTIIPVLNSNILGFTLSSDQAVISNPVFTEDRFNIPDTLLREQTSNITCILIGDSKYPFGIFSLLSRHNYNFNIDQIHFLQSVCNILAEAINRNNMEMSLRYERELSRKYLDVAEFMIIVIDEHKNILLANQYASSVLGYKQNELSGMNFIDNFIPENMRQQCSNIFTLMLRDQPYKIDNHDFDDNIIPLVNKNHDIRYIKWKTTLLYNEEGEVSSILSAGDDITEQLSRKEEQKQLEKQLQQAQKMEAIGMLAGGIAHDFNNILASILGFSDLIIEKLKPEDTILNDYISHIKSSGIKARDIIEQMQSINLQDDISIKATPLAPLLKNTLKMLRSALPSTIDLKTNINGNIPPVNINASTFNQLIMKLLINSRNALSGRGNIAIDLSTQTFNNEHCCTTCGSKINAEYAVISLHDNGPGISAENLSQAFKQFDSALPDSGIAYANKILHESNGHMFILSQQLMPDYKEKGTCIKLLFSISHLQAENDILPLKDLSSLQVSEKHLMIIDDENSVASYLGELFKGTGFIVTVFCDSADALSSFKQNPDIYDLIITDQTMPAITGDLLSAEMLQINPDLPIILCTGHSDIMTREKAEALNIKGFVKKPVDSAELLHLVFTLLI